MYKLVVFTLISSVPFEPDIRTNEGAASMILTSSLLLAVGNRCHRTTAQEGGNSHRCPGVGVKATKPPHVVIKAIP